MKKYILPRVIFVVGSAAAGKTTFARNFERLFTEFSLISDVEELQKLAEKEKMDGRQNRIVSLQSGSFDIIDPSIWDTALISTLRSVQYGKSYLIEFARGRDQKHLDSLGLSGAEVYYHSFEIMTSVLSDITNDEMFIIHVKCDFASRQNRNISRNKEGSRFVAAQVMSEVYKEDDFQYIMTGNNSGYLNDQNKIRVFSIDNSRELSKDLADTYFVSQIRLALEFYQRSRLSLR